MVKISSYCRTLLCWCYRTNLGSFDLSLPFVPIKVWLNTNRHMLSNSPLIHSFLFIGKDDAKMGPFRFVILFLGGIIAYFGSKAVELEGAGALAVLVMAFVAGIGW